MVVILLRRLETRVRMGAVWSTNCGKQLAEACRWIGVQRPRHQWSREQYQVCDENGSFHNFLQETDSGVSALVRVAEIRAEWARHCSFILPATRTRILLGST